MPDHVTACAGGLIRAAQYLRMSSENQRYSTENQQTAIAEYARQHGYQVIASYVDVGKSGLSLKGRDALRQLLSDALDTGRTFDAILVLDVSRWGRFQNPDQAAHYEFLCRQAGLRVVYCAEPFGDDVAPITTIIKHLKRVMAGEYSRELSEKLIRAHRQQAALGFRQGARLIYGFRRLLVDATGKPKQVMANGERKALDNDKVIVIPGPPHELAVIRRIFRLYVRNELSAVDIAVRLSKDGVKGHDDLPLAACKRRKEGTLLRRNRLLPGQPKWVHYRAEAILTGLRRLVKRQGKVSISLIEDDPTLPSAATISRLSGRSTSGTSGPTSGRRSDARSEQGRIQTYTQASERRKTGRPVKFELTESIRTGKKPSEYLFTGRRGPERSLTGIHCAEPSRPSSTGALAT